MVHSQTCTVKGSYSYWQHIADGTLRCVQGAGAGGRAAGRQAGRQAACLAHFQSENERQSQHPQPIQLPQLLFPMDVGMPWSLPVCLKGFSWWIPAHWSGRVHSVKSYPYPAWYNNNRNAEFNPLIFSLSSCDSCFTQTYTGTTSTQL